MSNNFSALTDGQDGRVGAADARAADRNEEIKGSLFELGGDGSGAARSGLSECHLGAGVSRAFQDEMRRFGAAVGRWNIDQAQPWPAHLDFFVPGRARKKDVEWAKLRAGGNNEAIRQIAAASAHTVSWGGFGQDLRDWS
jgi:hypothetical protein